MRDIALPPDGGLLSTIGNTPLVPLRRLFPGIAFDLYAKLELLNPGGSSKDRTALSLLREAWEEGRITSASTIVESSSGNLGIGIAQFCTYMGVRFICVVDSRTTPVNLKILEAYGVEIDMVRDCDAPSGDLLRARIARVQQLCEEIPDSFWPNQYANTANSRAHQTTMREIYESLQGKVDYLFVATSSCGTLRGCAEFLRRPAPPPGLSPSMQKEVLSSEAARDAASFPGTELRAYPSSINPIWKMLISGSPTLTASPAATSFFTAKRSSPVALPVASSPPSPG